MNGVEPEDKYLYQSSQVVKRSGVMFCGMGDTPGVIIMTGKHGQSIQEGAKSRMVKP
jgi:hypothetical protein